MHLGAIGSDFKGWNILGEKAILVTIDGHANYKKFSQNYKKVINKECIISTKNGYSNFYVTKDPDCSSLLEPNAAEHKRWYGSHRFKVDKKVKVKVSSINKFLKENKIYHIDWLVIDIQGLDLKIIKSLDPKIRNKISIVELEPGFSPIYNGADKIGEVFNYMTKNFEFADIKFGYNYKIQNENLSLINKKILFRLTKPSKFYSNIIFTNKNFKNERINLMKLIYLVINNNIFEARNFLNNNLQNNKFTKSILKKLNQQILILKIIYIISIPYFLIKKIFTF